jgi:hypothetical protein
MDPSATKDLAKCPPRYGFIDFNANVPCRGTLETSVDSVFTVTTLHIRDLITRFRGYVASSSKLWSLR